MRVRRRVLYPFLSLRCSSTSTTSTPRTKVQIAIVGSGPSGCYVAHHLTKRRGDVHVDLYESLPVPFGLCRYGVAPDHPEVKNVERQFLDMFCGGRVTWIGNIPIGPALPVALLLEHYAAVVVAAGTGPNAHSRALRVPGEELGGVVAARDFVHYYNTYPFPHGSPHCCPVDLRAARDVVIVGNGNVALDCARVLAAPYKRFAPTDMNCAAVRELMHSRVGSVRVVARRGHAHSAFTIAEFRELTRCDPNAVRVRVEPFDVDAALNVPAENPRARRRLMELLSRFAQPPSEETENTEKTEKAEKTEKIGNALQAPRSPHVRGPCVVDFHYNMRPVRFLPSAERPRCVGAAVFERTFGDGRPAETVTMPCDAVLTSIGYTSGGIAGVAFDSAAGAIPNTLGRVAGQPRVYCAGWAKNGPRGVIARALVDAQETATSILEDIDNGVIPTRGESTGDSGPQFFGKFGLIDYFVEKKLEPVSVAGLKRILHVEEKRGVDLGKRLEKINSVRDMLDVALGGEQGKKANNAIRGITNDRPDALLYLKELLDDTTDLAPFARHLAKDMMPVMAENHPPGRLDPSQL